VAATPATIRYLGDLARARRVAAPSLSPDSVALPPYRRGVYPNLDYFFKNQPPMRFPLWAGGRSWPFVLPETLLSYDQLNSMNLIPSSAFRPPGQYTRWGSAYAPPGWPKTPRTWTVDKGWHGDLSTGPIGSGYTGFGNPDANPNWDPRNTYGNRSYPPRNA